jgi:hypothetical protein
VARIKVREDGKERRVIITYGTAYVFFILYLVFLLIIFGFWLFLFIKTILKKDYTLTWSLITPLIVGAVISVVSLLFLIVLAFYLRLILVQNKKTKDISIVRPAISGSAHVLLKKNEHPVIETSHSSAIPAIPFRVSIRTKTRSEPLYVISIGKHSFPRQFYTRKQYLTIAQSLDIPVKAVKID